MKSWKESGYLKSLLAIEVMRYSPIFVIIVAAVFFFIAPRSHDAAPNPALSHLPASYVGEIGASDAAKQIASFVPLTSNVVQIPRDERSLWLAIDVGKIPRLSGPAFLYLDYVRLEKAELYRINRAGAAERIGLTGLLFPRESWALPQLRFPHLQVSGNPGSEYSNVYLVRISNKLPIIMKVELQKDGLEGRMHEGIDNLYAGILIGYGVLATLILFSLLYFLPDRLNLLYLGGTFIAFLFLYHYNGLPLPALLRPGPGSVYLFDALLSGAAIAMAIQIVLALTAKGQRHPFAVDIANSASLASVVLPVFVVFFFGSNPSVLLGLLFAVAVVVTGGILFTAIKLGNRHLVAAALSGIPLVCGSFVAALRDSGVVSNEEWWVKGAVEFGFCVHITIGIALLFVRVLSKHRNRVAAYYGHTRDALTGLLNKVGLAKFVDEMIERSRRNGHSYGLIKVQIRIKAASNFVLSLTNIQSIARVIENTAGEFNMAGRISDTEFYVAVETLGKSDDIKATASKVLSGLLRLNVFENQEKVDLSPRIAWVASSGGQMKRHEIFTRLDYCLDHWKSADRRSIREAKIYHDDSMIFDVSTLNFSNSVDVGRG